MEQNVTEVFKKMHRQHRMNVLKSFGFETDRIQKGSNSREFTEEQKDIIKGLSSDNPFEKAVAQEMLEKSEMSDIEKSDIFEAVSYSDDFKAKKSGKEIKEQISKILIPKKTAALEVAKAEADELLKTCGDAPTSNCCRWWLRDMDIDCGYKVYSWEETRQECCDKNCISNSLSYEHQEDKPKVNYPKTEDEEVARCQYNNKVQAICEILVDIKTCNILLKNLKDDAEIKMTPRQIIVFGFD